MKLKMYIICKQIDKQFNEKLSIRKYKNTNTLRERGSYTGDSIGKWIRSAYKINFIARERGKGKQMNC